MPFLPRPIMLLALAVLAAAPAAAQAPAGGSRSAQGGARPVRPVDDCGKPTAGSRSRRPGERESTAAARPAPRLLGRPASEVSASAAAGQAAGAGPQAATQQAQGAGATPAGAAGPQPSGDPPGRASSMRADSSQILSGTHPGTQASAVSADAGVFSGTSAEVDPRAARRNRGLLRLQGPGAGLRLGPAASVSVPTAFGVDQGEMFFGVAYQGRTRYTDEDDAAAVVGVGIGSRRLLALEAAVTTYSTLRGNPLETGGISLKLHRALPRQTSVAVGWENAILWGGADDRGSLYAAATKLVNLREDAAQPFSTAVVTLGLGNGRFRFERDDAADRERVNLFGALGVRVTGPLSIVTDWTGQDLNLAASVTPIRRVPLVITAGVADLTGEAGDGARFIVSLGYGLSLRQPF